MPEDEKTEGPSQEKEQVEKETSNYLEMEDSFADLKYPDVLHAIAETNELNVPWRDLKEQIKAALLEVLILIPFLYKFIYFFLFESISNAR